MSGNIEHGRLEVVAAVESFGPSAAADHLAAVLLGGRDQALAPVALRGADDRTHRRLGSVGGPTLIDAVRRTDRLEHLLR